MLFKPEGRTGHLSSSTLVLDGALAGLTTLCSPAAAQDVPAELQHGRADLFTSRVLTTGLSNPWEITWGPDDMLWVTERSTGEVTRVDPFTGEQQTLLTLQDFS